MKCFIFFVFLKFCYALGSNIRISNQNENCKYTLNDGHHVDFSHLRNNNDYEFSINRYTYKANFCGSLIDKCPGSSSPAAIFVKHNVCLYHLVNSWQQSSLDYIDSAISSKGVKISFPPGDKCYFGNSLYLVTYVLNCDPNKEIDFTTIIKKETCSFEYHFYTKYGCQNFLNYSKGSFGSKRILLILIVIFSFYCIGCTILNFRSNPEDGMIKALPNREFWTEFFVNVRAGINIAYKHIKTRFTGGNNNEYN